jgi:phage terminase large subunit-like protein
MRSAALALLHMYGPVRQPRGANYVAAADRGQARVCFEEALGIVQAIPQLAGASRPVDSKNRLTHPKSGSFFEALSSDGRNAHARTPAFILVDEFWAHRKADLWQALRTGATKAPGSLLIVAILPIVFEVDADDPWDCEKTLEKVLPGL